MGYHKECTRDKPDDYTATCPRGKVLNLARWVDMRAKLILTMGFLFLPLYGKNFKAGISMQQYVNVGKNMEQAIAWLEGHGYRNVQNLTAEGYNFPVLVIEEKVFFGTNLTCMAALSACGRRQMPWSAWLEL